MPSSFFWSAVVICMFMSHGHLDSELESVMPEPEWSRWLHLRFFHALSGMFVATFVDFATTWPSLHWSNEISFRSVDVMNCATSGTTHMEEHLDADGSFEHSTGSSGCSISSAALGW